MYRKEETVDIRNASGAYDPTFYEIAKKEMQDIRRFKNFLKIVFTAAEMGGFQVMEHIVVKDKRTGKLYK